MLRKMTRKAGQLAGKLDAQRKPSVTRIEAEIFKLLGIDAVPAPARDRTGKRRRHIGRKAERFASLAHRSARPVANDGGSKACAMPAEAVIDILDHLLAPLMLEIHVDIGRLIARVRDEALEKEVRAGGIDLGDAKGITDGRIGGRTAPLMQNVLIPRETDDVLHREEKRRVFEPGDQLELVADLLDDRSRRAIGPLRRRIAPLEPLPGQPFEAGLRVFAIGGDLIGIFVGQLLEAERTAARK